MSGSPIIQDEKHVGVVTYVLMNDPREDPESSLEICWMGQDNGKAGADASVFAPFGVIISEAD